MIAFACGGCGKSYQVQDDRAGRRFLCKGCNQPLEVPAGEGTGMITPPRAPYEPEDVPRQRRRRRPSWAISREAWIALGVGGALAALTLWVPFLRLVLYALITVIHELGHTTAGWAFGYPALPQFDLTYGGGRTRLYDRHSIVVALIGGWIVSMLWEARGDRRALILRSVAAAAYVVAFFTPIHNQIINAMGHGSEMIFAGIFLYRALSGAQILRDEERPLYATLGLCLIARQIHFEYGLITSVASRQAYSDAKGGGDVEDLSQIGFFLGWTVQGVALLFLIACALTPLASYIAYRYLRR